VVETNGDEEKEKAEWWFLGSGIGKEGFVKLSGAKW
jgi:hypothetical protein